jgi:hypothetical protein
VTINERSSADTKTTTWPTDACREHATRSNSNRTQGNCAIRCTTLSILVTPNKRHRSQSREFSFAITRHCGPSAVRRWICRPEHRKVSTLPETRAVSLSGYNRRYGTTLCSQNKKSVWFSTEYTDVKVCSLHSIILNSTIVSRRSIQYSYFNNSQFLLWLDKVCVVSTLLYTILVMLFLVYYVSLYRL